MRYITWNHVANRYQSFAKGGGAAQDPYIQYAEDEVDARLAPRYTVPFTPVPGIVQDLVIDLAYYKSILLTEQAEAFGKYLEARFKAILDGSILITTSAGPLGTREQAWSTHQDYHTAFGVDPVENWAVSSSWALDNEDARG